MDIPSKNKHSQAYSTFIRVRELREIEMVEQELVNSTASLSGQVEEICTHIINSGGKRIRPLLVLYSGMCFGPLSHLLVKTAAAAELIHLASLVHDDIIDNSALRHSSTTLNYTYGNHISVLAGDYLFAKAFEILCSNRLHREMKFLVHAIENMCEGEILQNLDIKEPSYDLQDYMKRIEKKTARLISACCKAGASISDAGDTYTDIMELYGLKLGYAFQIIDDILDLRGTPEKLGKPVFSDLMQGNITLPILILLETDNRFLPHINGLKDNSLPTEKLQSIIVTGLHETGALDKAYTIAQQYCQEAKAYLQGIPESHYRQFLSSLPDLVIARCG